MLHTVILIVHIWEPPPSQRCVQTHKINGPVCAGLVYTCIYIASCVVILKFELACLNFDQHHIVWCVLTDIHWFNEYDVHQCTTGIVVVIRPPRCITSNYITQLESQLHCTYLPSLPPAPQQQSQTRLHRQVLVSGGRRSSSATPEQRL